MNGMHTEVHMCLVHAVVNEKCTLHKVYLTGIKVSLKMGTESCFRTQFLTKSLQYVLTLQCHQGRYIIVIMSSVLLGK